MSLNVIFMGTPEFSLPALDELIRNNFNILTVYTQPPKKSKRGQKINPSLIEEFAREKNLNLRNPSSLNNVKELKFFKNLSTYEEGCLSVPGQFAEIDRSDRCHIKYLDYHGKHQEIKAEGMLATCIQHEMDHLEGILFIDYLSKLKRSMIAKKLSKQKKELERIVV